MMQEVMTKMTEKCFKVQYNCTHMHGINIHEVLILCCMTINSPVNVVLSKSMNVTFVDLFIVFTSSPNFFLVIIISLP